MIRCAYAETPRGALHYAEAGEGPPLLLLHSTPRSHRQFRHLMPALAGHFRAIAVDAPGYGQSHALPAPTTMPWMAESLVMLLDALGLERAHVLGFHTGNKIAAALACHWPARVDRMVFAGQTHSIIVEGPERNAAIRAFCDRYFCTFDEAPDGSHHVRGWAAAHAIAQGYWWPQKLQTGSPIAEEDVLQAEIQVIDYLQGRHSIVPTYEAILAYDLADALRRVQAPTLVLEFLTDREAHFGSQAERVSALIRRGSFAFLHNADGTVPERRPGDLAAAITRFLTDDNRPSASWPAPGRE